MRSLLSAGSVSGNVSCSAKVPAMKGKVRTLGVGDVELTGGSGGRGVEPERVVEVEGDGELAPHTVEGHAEAAAQDALALAPDETAQEIVAEVGRPGEWDRRADVVPVLLVEAGPVVGLARTVEREQL